MRTSTLARAGAVLTASALAFSLGTGTASAAEDVQIDKSFTTVPEVPPVKKAPKVKLDLGASLKRSAVELAPGDPDLTTFALARNQVLYSKGDGNFLRGTVVIANEPAAKYNLTTMFMNGHEFLDYNPYLESGFATKEPLGGVWAPSIKGPGLYDFGPSAIFYSDTPGDYIEDTTHSNTIRVRNATRGETTYYRSGRYHKVTASIKVFKPSVGIFGGGITSARLQYKSGGTWKAYKTIKLNKYGKGSVSWSTSSKRTYRVLVPTTLSVQGDNDGGTYF
ncbi:hypothetical protein [Aeromicrobium sp. NPDC092404]|uniref:hypothetical protein n=1 Tax=Aeromicrobium sp. NPDC092404 TaxID=3154976 RepID=UPI003435393C